MANPLGDVFNTVAEAFVGQSHNRYALSINTLTEPLSVVSIQGHEQLNQPWRYEVTFSCQDKHILVNTVLSQRASLTFLAPNRLEQVTKISSLEHVASDRTLYGVITEFSLLSVNKDEARYRVVVQPRLALFAHDNYSAIYQNQSVINVVEEVLRRHGFTGIDYRLELKDSYRAREFITQWQETDLAFIVRLLADIGCWFLFESHAEHNCDVLVISDYEQGLQNAGSIIFKAQSGMVDSQRNSVWDLQFSSKTVPSQVIVDDYNYRTAESDMNALVNSQVKDSTTRGTDYRYGEHYKSKGNDSETERLKFVMSTISVIALLSAVNVTTTNLRQGNAL